MNNLYNVYVFPFSYCPTRDNYELQTDVVHAELEVLGCSHPDLLVHALLRAGVDCVPQPRPHPDPYHRTPGLYPPKPGHVLHCVYCEV